jgi:hypothetical protein
MRALKYWLVCAALALACAPAQARIFNQAELDALVAPIALYPDSLLTQILVAATYPEELALAAAWSRANPQLSGDEALGAVEREPWDAAVKSLVAFPEVLARMDESPQWTRDLGEAFLRQEPHVMDTVQSLRRRAQAAGNLQSDGEYAVEQHGGAIVVAPRTEVIYVRYYDPYIVYGPWWWPHYRPVFWRPWPARPVHITHFHVAPRKWHKQSPSGWKKHRPQEHRPRVTVREYRRVPESRRQPIIQSAPRLQSAPPQLQSASPQLQSAPPRLHRAPPRLRSEHRTQRMPAASGFSNNGHRGGFSQNRQRGGGGWHKQR